MNAGIANTIESLFGPPSELIDCKVFLALLSAQLEEPVDNQEAFHDDIVNECDVADIRDSLQNIWNNPVLSGYLIRDHDRTVTALHSTLNQKAKSSRKRPLLDSDTQNVEVKSLQKNLNAVSLTSFRLGTESAFFMRAPKNSDYNTLQQMKAHPEGRTPGSQEAVIKVSVYNKVPWGPSYVTRSSQHSFLSSNKLEDIYNSIYCTSKHLPVEAGLPKEGSGCVICIEGLAYGTRTPNVDYADKLIKICETLVGKSIGPIKKSPTDLGNTPLASLSFRVGEPYWLIHDGNCEHFIVIDQIRLFHPRDPLAGYPLTLQLTPPILDICRACAKVPAVLSVIGDIRLGESPCLICEPCWKTMGEPEEESVTVMPLPQYMY